jgi:hypothetical protein
MPANKGTDNSRGGHSSNYREPLKTDFYIALPFIKGFKETQICRFIVRGLKGKDLGYCGVYVSKWQNVVCVN